MTAFDIVTFIVGVVASALVFFSYIFKNQIWLRIVNMVASIIFVVYGLCLLCGTYYDWNNWTALPVVLLNAASAAVHAFYLVRYWFGRKKKTEAPTEKVEEVTINLDEAT